MPYRSHQKRTNIRALLEDRATWELYGEGLSRRVAEATFSVRDGNAAGITVDHLRRTADVARDR